MTLFYSDVSGFSALTERLGDERAFEVMSGFLALLRRLAREHGGREVEVRGDACLLTFESADSGLDFASEVQRALAARRREPQQAADVLGAEGRVEAAKRVTRAPA